MDKKRIFTCLIIVMSLIGATGCGSSATGTTSTGCSSGLPCSVSTNIN